jgi:hypothetical protein
VRSSNKTLIKAMRILGSEIKSQDGVANAAILEAACRIQELNDALETALTSMLDSGYSLKSATVIAAKRALGAK